MSPEIKKKLGEMSDVRRRRDATTSIVERQKLDDQLKAGSEALARMPADAEDLAAIREFGDGKDFGPAKKHTILRKG